MTDEQLRWIYEQVAKQFEREDNLCQTRIGSCVVVNLALLAAVATQINLPHLDPKNLVIILGCSAAGSVITYGTWSALALGEEQLANLRKFFGDMGFDPGLFPPPFLIVADRLKDEAPGNDGDRATRKRIFYPWTPIILAFQVMWVAIPIFALLAFFRPNIFA